MKAGASVFAPKLAFNYSITMSMRMKIWFGLSSAKEKISMGDEKGYEKPPESPPEENNPAPRAFSCLTADLPRSLSSLRAHMIRIMKDRQLLRHCIGMNKSKILFNFFNQFFT